VDLYEARRLAGLDIWTGEPLTEKNKLEDEDEL
jgi:hypothetical protein